MIYVMRVGERWKVGYSHDPVERAYQLSGQHGHCDVALVALGMGSMCDEAAIQNALAPLRARKRKLEREYYADCAEFRLWHDAVDAFWRGHEVFRAERRWGVITRPPIAPRLRKALRDAQRRERHDSHCGFGQRLAWHTTAEHVLRRAVRRGAVGCEQAEAVDFTLPVESDRQREITRLYGPLGSGPPLPPIPHAWRVHAGALRVSFRCEQCRSRHTVPFPKRAYCYGSADPVRTATAILFGAVGPPSVAHHRGTLEKALEVAAVEGCTRMGLHGVASHAMEPGPIEVRFDEVATDIVGLGSEAHPQRVEAQVRVDDPDPIATLQRLWQGLPQARHAAGVVALASARWGWRSVGPTSER